MGVKRSILHASRRRNHSLARIFHDLKLMEREGSGIDRLTSGPKVPTISEGTDSIHVTVPRRVVPPGVIKPRPISATSSSSASASPSRSSRKRRACQPSNWSCRTPRLCAPGLVGSWRWGLWSNRGAPMLHAASCRPRSCAKLDSMHSPHSRGSSRTGRARMVEDLERYPDSGRADIHRRMGPEIHEKAVARALEALLPDGVVTATGERRWRKYRLADDKGHRRVKFRYQPPWWTRLQVLSSSTPVPDHAARQAHLPPDQFRALPDSRQTLSTSALYSEV